MDSSSFMGALSATNSAAEYYYFASGNNNNSNSAQAATNENKKGRGGGREDDGEAGENRAGGNEIQEENLYAARKTREEELEASSPENREQNLWLEDALSVVKKHAFHMKRAIEENNLRDSLKNASAMLGELRTRQLSPKRYYDLWHNIAFELEFLREFFVNKEEKHGRSAMELYELVQHAGNVLPRLYLLVCVG